MSRHQSLIRAWSTPLQFSQFADQGRVTITPRNGVISEPWAIVDDEERKERPVANGLEVVFERCITICIDTASGYYAGLEDVKLNATATVDSVSYAISEIAAKGQSYIELKLTRLASSENSRTDYRNRKSYADLLNRT